jgi:capsular polysaccharide biosynthesis protein
LVNVLALGLAIAGLMNLFQPAEYRSQVDLYAVAVNRQITSSDLYNSTLMAQARIPVYAQLVQTPQVLDPTVADLNLSVTSRELARRVAVTYEDEQSVMQIVARADRPARAKELSDAIARNLANVVAQLEKSGRQTGAVELRVLSEGSFPTQPSSPHRLINLVVGLAIGAAAASVLFLLTAVQITFRRRRTASQWAYLTVDGEQRLALLHLVQDGAERAAVPSAGVQLSMRPVRGTVPSGASDLAAETQRS